MSNPDNITPEQIQADLEEAEKISAYEATPATYKDVHRIIRNSLQDMIKRDLEPRFNELAKVATVAIFVQEVMVRKGLATEEDFKQAIDALKEAGVIRAAEGTDTKPQVS